MARKPVTAATTTAPVTAEAQPVDPVAVAAASPHFAIGSGVSISSRSTANGTAYGVTFNGPRLSGTALIKVLAMLGYTKLAIRAAFGVLGLPLSTNTLNAQYQAGNGAAPGDDTAHSKVVNPAQWPADFKAAVKALMAALDAAGQPAQQAYADLTKTNAAKLPAVTVKPVDPNW